MGGLRLAEPPQGTHLGDGWRTECVKREVMAGMRDESTTLDPPT